MATAAVRRPRRWVVRTIAGVVIALTVLIGTGVVGVLTAPTAAANPFDPMEKICKNDQTLALPAGADNGTTTASNERVRVDGLAVVKPAGVDEGWRTAGDGLSFTTFGMSICHDASDSVMTAIGSIIWQVVAVWPAKIVGMGLDWALSGALSVMLLGIVAEPMARLHDGIFLTWAPLIICLSIIGGIFEVARRRGNPLSDVGWMVGVVAIIAIIVSPTGIDIAKTITTATGQAATCAAVAPMGGCVDGKGSVSSTVIDGLLQQTWGAAILGDLADAAIPATLTLNGDLADSTPDIRGSYAVTVPIEAIPAGTDGVVSYSDALRWTNAYTAAESNRLSDEPAARCGFRDRLPVIGDVTDPAHKGLNADQLCSSKALVRAAIYSDLATGHPGAYAAATGKGGGALGAGLAALFGLLPLMVGVAAIAVMALIAEVEAVLLLVVSPLVALGALRDASVGRKWGEEILATLVKRFSVGATLGICLWAVSAISAKMTELFSGKAGTGALAGVILTAIGPKILPVAVAIISAVAMVGAFKLLTKLQSILLAGVGLPDGSGAGMSGGRRLTSMALSASIGALGVPTKAIDVMRYAVPGLRRDGETLGTGDGRGPRRHPVPMPMPMPMPMPAPGPMPEPAPVPTPTPDPLYTGAPGPAVGPRAGDQQTADESWERLRATTTARAQRAAAMPTARQQWLDALDALDAAEQAKAEHDETFTSQVRTRVDALVRGGADAETAEQQATGQVSNRGEELKRAVNGARLRQGAAEALLRDGVTAWDRAADRWARSSATTEDAIAALHLDDADSQAAFVGYRRDVNPAAV